MKITIKNGVYTIIPLTDVAKAELDEKVKQWTRKSKIVTRAA